MVTNKVVQLDFFCHMRILDLVNEHNWFGRMQPMLQILKKYECFCIRKANLVCILCILSLFVCTRFT